ncbi:hypothetical protein HMPREF1982_03279 [Clostridiales bacterium oral taxon 876 str. F0540]|nr:hypothetical protein HMPREF1982_03279 [Clostridiales bacterium oral taxon 876 str. F0540]
MIKNGTTIYKISLFILLVIAAVLSSLDISLINDINNKSNMTKNKVEPLNSTVRKYGYSEILNLVLKNEDIKISNISTSSENNSQVRIDINFKETYNLNDVYKYIEDIRSENCFLGIENVKIDKDNQKNKNISLTVFFRRNK